MTTILKRDEFRNNADDCTIIVEQFIEPSYNRPFWRYFVRYDRYGIIGGYSDSLLTRPSRKRLAARF